MKHLSVSLTLSLLLFGVLCTQSANAQDLLTRNYSTLTYMDSLSSNFSAVQANRSIIERQLKKDSRFGRPTPTIIPVIFHVLYTTEEDRATKTSINEQMAALNRDFGLESIINNHPNDPDRQFAQLAVDTEIEFCLPQAIEGINYYETTVPIWTDRAGIKVAGTGAAPIDPARYLNVWVVNLPEDEAGYAQMPGGDVSTDGIVINRRYFGMTDAVAPFNEGKTLTHLIGNYLGLYPLWGNGRCWDDFVWDTPISNMRNAGCPEANHISTDLR